MARPPRIERPGAWYHLTNRGIERRPIFTDQRDHSHFVELLPAWVERFGVRIHAYVLMPNHCHLLLETPRPNLSLAMQWLNLSYSVWFNRRHRRCGPLFQGRFKAIIFEPQTTALTLSRYLHLNPVRIRSLGLDKTSQQTLRAGLSAKPEPELIARRLSLLRAHPWSSYPAYAGRKTAPPWLQTTRMAHIRAIALTTQPGRRRGKTRVILARTRSKCMTLKPALSLERCLVMENGAGGSTKGISTGGIGVLERKAPEADTGTNSLRERPCLTHSTPDMPRGSKEKA